jgi:hypothetical protein
MVQTQKLVIGPNLLKKENDTKFRRNENACDGHADVCGHPIESTA